MVASTFLLSVLLYVDRTCISTAKDAVTEELGLSELQWSWVLASFAFGYALLQTPSGALADRLGGRAVLTVVVVAWSIFTGLTSAARGFLSLLLVRFAFGAGEAGAFPGMARVVYSWIPVQRTWTGEGNQFLGFAHRCGTGDAGDRRPDCQYRMEADVSAADGCWDSAGRSDGGIGFGMNRRSTPASRTKNGNTSCRTASRPRRWRTPEPLPLAAMLGSGNLWLMMIQYFGSNFTFFFSLSWLYPYVKSRYQLDAVDAGFYAMVPLLAGACGNILSGWTVDRLFRAGFPVASRRVPAIIGFALAAAGMVLSLDQSTPAGAVFWLSVAIFGADMTLSPSWSFCIDIGGRHAGAVSGTMNMAGNLGSAITALAFAYLPESERGNVAFFYTAAGLSIVAIICWLLTRPGRTIQA